MSVDSSSASSIPRFPLRSLASRYFAVATRVLPSVSAEHLTRGRTEEEEEEIRKEKRTHHLRRFVLPLINEKLERLIDTRSELGRGSETLGDEGLGGVPEGDEVGHHLGVEGLVED